MLGISTRTIREWDANGKLTVIRSAGGHRRIPMSEIERLTGDKNDNGLTIAYCRVSTKKQEENLERQVGRVLEKCSKEEWHTELIKDIGSGLNENRKGLKKLIKMVSDGKVKRIVVEYKDRLMRFGLDTFLSYCSKFGTEVLILQDQKGKAFEEELAEDMVALVTSYSARLYGRRGGRKRHV